MPSTFHLVCNAHLDPYWQWDWEEGAAEAISTFRTAADLCEEFDGFVFNHNEVILYEWVREYEPSLFERIQRLVREGKWHIMGGWYLQPDCNMPSGESFVRQALLGRIYFEEHFGVRPTTAMNFDPFGHTRGLVQILKKAGFDSYLFCRPGQKDSPLPADVFTWVGYDGSEVVGHRSPHHYNSPLGGAAAKVTESLKEFGDRPVVMVLWGVGNHGGGPSRKDLAALRNLIDTTKEADLRHSTPEAFFALVRESGVDLPRHEDDINPWAVGCYTSMVRVKQKHRELENAIYAVEKMSAAASAHGLMAYPKAELDAALRDLATAQFHDILPGSSIQPVENSALRLLDHGLELMSRVRARAFFSLCSGQPKAPEGQIPVMVCNPHPFPVTGTWTCEFQLPDITWEEQFTVPTVHQDGQPVPSQPEKEYSNLSLDWRKRVVFQATLAPGQVSRFDCNFEVLPARPEPNVVRENGHVHFTTERLDVVINGETGLMDKLAVDGVDYVEGSAFHGLVIRDDEDPWGMRVRSYRDEAGGFRLLSRAESARFCGVREPELDPVRVIEDGDVRTVVETNFGYGDSYILQTYRLPKQGTEIEVEVRVHWNEKDTMLKWSVPTTLDGGAYLGQHAYGVEELPANGDECVAQQWTAVVDRDANRALTCANDSVYGSDFLGGELRMTLVRSPAYCAHPIYDRPLVPQDRYTPRIDQGERLFRFRVNAGPVDQRLAAVGREALALNEAPFALSFFPNGEGAKPEPLLVLDDEAILCNAVKRAERGEDIIVRLFEPTGAARSTTVRLPGAGIEETVDFGPFEIKSFRVDAKTKRLVPVDLTERDLRPGV